MLAVLAYRCSIARERRIVGGYVCKNAISHFTKPIQNKLRRMHGTSHVAACRCLTHHLHRRTRRRTPRGNMAAHEFQVDPIAANLKDGDRPQCAGLVLVVGWGWGKDPATRYETLASEMASLDPDAQLVYHPQHLHCTVATLSRCVQRQILSVGAQQTSPLLVRSR